MDEVVSTRDTTLSKEVPDNPLVMGGTKKGSATDSEKPTEDITAEDKQQLGDKNNPENPPIRIEDLKEEPVLKVITVAERFHVRKMEELLESHDPDVKTMEKPPESHDLNINEMDEEGNNAVHRMIMTYIELDLVEQMHSKPKYLEILGLLLRKGFNINGTNNQGDTALHLISRYHGYADIIKPLLASGAKVNAKNGKGLTALHVTVIKGLTTNAQTLIEGGADPNLADSSGRTPLHLLVQGKRNIITLQHLLKCGAQPMATDSGGRTPLHVASKWGRVEFMRELLICGAKPNVTDHSGQTPLHYAIKGDLTGGATQLLLEYKAYPDFQDQISRETAMHKAIKLAMVGNIEELIKVRPNLNLPNVLGNTPLHVAANCTEMRVWDLLLRHGGDINLQNWQGFSPLQKAIKAKNQIALSLMRVYDTSNVAGY